MTAGAIGFGLAGAEGATAAVAPTVAQAAPAAATVRAPAADLADAVRGKSLSRAASDRVGASTRTVAPQVVKRFTTDGLNLRTAPAEDAEVAGEVAAGTQVKFTGLTEGDYAEILWKGERRWVTAAYLSAKKPVAPASIGLSAKPCPDGSVDKGLTDRAVRVYRAVCNAFPDIPSYGGWDNHGEHTSGRAIDIMQAGDEADKIAEFLRANAAELELSNVIWRQRIWTPVRSAEGWRGMPDRGSATANHLDHVHVSVN